MLLHDMYLASYGGVSHTMCECDTCTSMCRGVGKAECVCVCGGGSKQLKIPHGGGFGKGCKISYIFFGGGGGGGGGAGNLETPLATPLMYLYYFIILVIYHE